MSEEGKQDRSVHRRDFLRVAGLGAVALTAAGPAACATGARRRPNVILMVADDLGWAELGSYGQEKIRTPNLDRLAAQGMRFTNAYSGSPVCAPSRCVLLTGMHTGHAYIRDNDEMSDRGDVWRDLSLEGQRPLPPGTTTIGTLFQDAGYVTGAMGKWGLGGPGSTGAPNRQGFDRWYGYLCQRLAHNYYPVHLWSDSTKHELDNDYFHPHQRLPEDRDPDDPASYADYQGDDYAPDLMADEALAFVRDHADDPFFLYLPFIVPHVAIQVPDDSLAAYDGAFEETPYLGDSSYLPHPTPRAAYAAMITRMDRDVGRVMDLLDELGLADDTVVFFTSDNGPTWVGGADTEFFESKGPLRGRKAQIWEGGIRVPLIARWPGRIHAGSISDFPCAFQDFLPTLAELAGARVPTWTDGVSLVDVLLDDRSGPPDRDYLYWEFQGWQAIRMGDWKGVWRPDGTFELFHLGRDLGETTDVAAANADVVARLEEIRSTARTESDLFPLRRS